MKLAATMIAQFMIGVCIVAAAYCLLTARPVDACISTAWGFAMLACVEEGNQHKDGQ